MVNSFRKRNRLSRNGETVDVNEALDELLGEERTGSMRSDLIRAARESMRRRQVNTLAGGVVLAALHHEVGMSYREIESATEIPMTTIYRWATPPPTTEE